MCRDFHTKIRKTLLSFIKNILKSRWLQVNAVHACLNGGLIKMFARIPRTVVVRTDQKCRLAFFTIIILGSALLNRSVVAHLDCIASDRQYYMQICQEILNFSIIFRWWEAIHLHMLLGHLFGLVLIIWEKRVVGHRIQSVAAPLLMLQAFVR